MAREILQLPVRRLRRHAPGERHRRRGIDYFVQRKPSTSAMFDYQRGVHQFFFHSFSVLMVKFQFVNGQIPSCSSCLVILPFSSSPTAPSAARNLGRSQIFSAKCPAFDKGIINGGFPAGLLTWMVPSGKRLHSELENHHFLWVNPLQITIFNSFVYVYQRVCEKSHDMTKELDHT